MRQVTEKIIDAFTSGKVLKVGNSYTDGVALFLFDNKIAEKRNGELWITNAGWQSNTTKERLNGLPGVSISQSKGVWYLNGSEWNGEWTKIGSKFVESGDGGNIFKSIVMVSKMGDLLCDKKADKNKWKQRMMKAGLGEGVNFPDDWDALSEEEKERRLNGALEQLK